MSDLFQRTRKNVNATLFKGAGPCRTGEQVVRHVKRTGALSRVFPNRLLYRRSQVEFATFALRLFPYLINENFDLIHFIDPQLAVYLHWMRRVTGERFSLLFTNGGPVSFECSRYADHVHCPTPTVFEETLRSGGDPVHTTMVPPGVDPEGLRTSVDRCELRKRAGISANTLVILSVTSLNRKHKRVDYLIEEVSKVDGDFLLWIDAGLHPDGDPALLQLAASRLGSRFRHTHVPSEQVKELYCLAEVMVSSSLHESFGMAIVEAMCCGLPVVTHDSDHFRWLVGTAGYFADMRFPGGLASKLLHLIQHRAELQNCVEPSRAIRRFGWDALEADYLKMYDEATVSTLVTARMRTQ